ncbi:MAG TPA: ABC transporter substrate-binding protein [candidate division Zixibacteria bacterium]|nr:ABC transporter substrate-binding protein [candidate division Zixibacteria bacterium]
MKAARWAWVSAALLAIGATDGGRPTSASAAGAPTLQKVNVAYSSISGNNTPLFVTHEKGFFRKHGLDVQVILIESGSTTAQSLISGDIAFAHMAGAAVLQSNLRGSDAVMIAGVINTLNFQLFTDKSISRPDQFKGKSVGVTRYGSSTDFAMRYALEKYGLDADKDVAILQLGNVPALLSAMEAGKIQGAMLSPPTTLRAKRLGFPVLADLQMLGLEYQHTGIATTRALIRSKPDLVRAFMRAYVEGIHYAKTHRKETVEILARYMRTDDRDVLDETYETTIASLVPRKPYPTLKGIQIMLRELAAKEPAARTAKPEQFVDLTFVQELDSSGYIDRLYKTAAVASAPRPEPPQPSPAPARIATSSKSEKARAAAGEVKAVPVARQNQEHEKPATQVARAVKPAPASERTAGAQTYIVKQGDTLSKLAERFYNSMNKWEKIYEANRDVVKNPNYIYIGMKLVIPADEAS